MHFKISAKVVVLGPTTGFYYLLNEVKAEQVNMNMLILQKLAKNSGKKPHSCAIEIGGFIKHFCSVNFKYAKAQIHTDHFPTATLNADHNH